jgi:ABC-2 type transport system ATP-binding protein
VEVLKQVLQRLAQQDVDVVDVGLRRPTLDDVFLSLTGHVAEEAEETNGESDKPKRGRRNVREKEAVR